MKKSTTAQSRPNWRRSLLSLAVGAALFTPMTAMAVEFELKDGEVTGSLDTTVSYGALWRVTGRDKENIAAANGGVRASANYDNGNLNYDRGDLVSSAFKMTNDLDLNYKNFGAFFRVLSFYDHAIQNKDFDPLRSDQRVLRNRLGHDYEIFDAYLRGSFKIGDKNLNIRAGKQVVSWGESTFIPNGINIINPVDVAKLRAPGAELKEAFLPVNMLWLSQEINDNLTIEAFNQFTWKQTRLEPNGSYFSTNDFASPGGTQVLRGGGTVNEDTANSNTQTQAGTTLSRSSDKNPKNSNQYGVALRLLAPNLNNTEFGAYYINYHSRTPIIAGTTGTFGSNPSTPGFIQAQYNNEFPEDIHLMGLSFNTLGPFGIALQGEYSFRPNQPLQLAAPDLLAELILQGCAATGTGIGTNGGCTGTTTSNGAIGTGVAASGFKSVKFHQFQMTATQTFGPQLKANQVVGIFEGGYTYTDLQKGVPFNAVGVDFGTGTDPRSVSSPNLDAAAANRTSVLDSGLATNNSYGYRAVLRADYLSAVQSLNLSPRIAWSHDLRGVSSTFNQGTKAVSIGLNANYQQNLQFDISYTNFFGGETYSGRTGIGQFNTNGTPVDSNVPANPADPAADRAGLKASSTNNPLSDRDFIAATVSYAF